MTDPAEVVRRVLRGQWANEHRRAEALEALDQLVQSMKVLIQDADRWQRHYALKCDRVAELEQERDRLREEISTLKLELRDANLQAMGDDL